MTVVVLIAAPEGLRGHLTRWLFEVAAGVFVGNPSARVRDRLWTVLSDRIGSGQVVMVQPAKNDAMATSSIPRVLIFTITPSR